MIITWHKAKTVEKFACNALMYQHFTTLIFACNIYLKPSLFMYSPEFPENGGKGLLKSHEGPSVWVMGVEGQAQHKKLWLDWGREGIFGRAAQYRQSEPAWGQDGIHMRRQLIPGWMQCEDGFLVMVGPAGVSQPEWGRDSSSNRRLAPKKGIDRSKQCKGFMRLVSH